MVVVYYKSFVAFHLICVMPSLLKGYSPNRGNVCNADKRVWDRLRWEDSMVPFFCNTKEWHNPAVFTAKYINNTY